MKDNQKYAIAGMVIVAILAVFVAYKFFYSADVEKAEQLQGEINTLQARADELTAKTANRSMYESGISNADDIIDTVLALYGPGNTPEKTIMLVVDLCRMTGVSVSDIAFQDNRLIYASETASEEETPELQIYQAGMQLNISSGYTQLKKLTDYINSYPERMNAENFTVAFDAETGRLNVTMKVNMYSVVDDKHEYIAPTIEDIELGSTNIFRTLEVTAEEEGEENAEQTSDTAPQGNGETGAAE